MNLLTELENRIRFETLISDISARFTRSPSSEVDGEIERALKNLLDFFDVDICAILGVREDKAFAWVTHASYAEGIKSVPKDINMAQLFPWAYEMLIVKGLPISVSRLTELPPEAEQDRLSCLDMGFKSYITIPLFGAQGIGYLLAIQSLRNERNWPNEFIPRLNLLGGIFVNAMERRNADRALRESQSRLNLAADSAGAGLWILDIATGGFWLTDKTRELFNFPSDCEINFDYFLNIVHPDDREQIRQVVDQARHSKETISVQYRIIRPDGTIRWMASRGRIYSGDSEEMDRLMGVSIDITERKRAEKELEDRLQFERLLTDLSAGFINSPADQVDREIEDAQHRICECLGLDLSALWQFSVENPRFLKLTHIYRSLGGPPLPEPMNAQEYFPWCQKQLIAGQLIILSSIEEAPAEAARDRETWRHLGIKTSLTIPLIAGGGPTFGAISFNDMKKERQWTEPLVKQFELIAQIFANALFRKRTEEEIFRIREEYTHIARVSAMGELTASLAHELKQPLAAIRSNAQAALRFITGDKPDIDELHEILKDIIIDNRRADDVIKKLRALMRKSELHITELNMKELVEDILPLVTSHEAMRKISLSLELDETIPLVAGDRIQIQQVILNLILNSTEALMKMKKQSRSIIVRAHQQDTRMVMLSVKDNGPGIEAKVMPHLFEAFYTTKPEGLGMGLAICRSIVESHGGRLWTQNNPDGGAAFYFTIPIAKED